MDFRIRRRVEFADTDMGGIAHFSRFFVFMETAEHEFLRSLGTSVHIDWQGQRIGWPRVEATCSFVRPVRYGDEVEIAVSVARKGKRSLTYSFEISHAGEAVARGRMTSVCCVLDDPAGLRAIDIPPFMAEQIRDTADD